MSSPHSASQETRAPGHPPRRFGVFRFSAVELLIALGLLFLTAPLVEELPQGDLIELIPASLVMIFAVLAVGGTRRNLITALVLAAPSLFARWHNYANPNQVSPVIGAAFGLIFFSYVAAQLIRFILLARQVNANVMCAGISGFLLLGVAWSPLYLLIYRLDPTAFTLPSVPGGTTVLDGFNAFYFSFITLCTVGYGDITPVSRGAKMTAVLEAIAGLFYVAVLISRLVSIHSANPQGGPAPPTEKS